MFEKYVKEKIFWHGARLKGILLPIQYWSCLPRF